MLPKSMASQRPVSRVRVLLSHDDSDDEVVPCQEFVFIGRGIQGGVMQDSMFMYMYTGIKLEL